MSDYWGHHLILDCRGCDSDAIEDYDTIYRFVKQLVKDIDMVAYGEPQIINFGTGNKAGYTLSQLIETSNITAHFVNELDEVYLDVFSCKEFEPKVVVNLVHEYFKPENIKSTFMIRDA